MSEIPVKVDARLNRFGVSGSCGQGAHPVHARNQVGEEDHGREHERQDDAAVEGGSPPREKIRDQASPRFVVRGFPGNPEEERDQPPGRGPQEDRQTLQEAPSPQGDPEDQGGRDQKGQQDLGICRLVGSGQPQHALDHGRAELKRDEDEKQPIDQRGEQEGNPDNNPCGA